MVDKAVKVSVAQTATTTKFLIAFVVGVELNILSTFENVKTMKIPYFKIKEAFNEARDSFSYGSGSDKLTSTAKLLSKSVANVGLLAVEFGVEVIKKAPEIVGEKAKEHLDKNSHAMTEEQITRAKEAVEKGKESRERRLAKEEEKENNQNK